MKKITCSLETLSSLRSHWEPLLFASEHCDPCNSDLSWQWAGRSFHPKGESLIFYGEEIFVLGQVIENQGFKVLWPLENMWRYGCPILTSDLNSESYQQLWSFLAQEVDAVVLSGVRSESVTSSLPKKGWSLMKLLEPSGVRLLIDLRQGFESYLSRRFSSRKRRRWEKALHKLEREGWRWKSLTPKEWQEFVVPLMQVERRSWKGEKGEGLNSLGMQLFYESLSFLAGPAGELRWILLEDPEGEPRAYCLGHYKKGRYRGLQFSFDQNYAHLGLGNLIQLKMLEERSLEGCEVFDLGQMVDYKIRWADEKLVTHSLVLRKI